MGPPYSVPIILQSVPFCVNLYTVLVYREWTLLGNGMHMCMCQAVVAIHNAVLTVMLPQAMHNQTEP